MHDSLNCGYFEDARLWLSPGRVACVTYCGEWSGGFGFSRNWVNPTADHFYARTELARARAIECGLPPERSSVFRKLLPPKDFEDNLQPHEFQSFKSRELQLDPQLFTVLLATGLHGSNHHIQFLRSLLPLSHKVQAIVVCGRNHQAFESVQAWTAKHPQLRVHVEGYCKRMQRFMQVSDAVITRPGSNTSAEALHFKCPIIYNTLGGIMPQEQLTLRFFADCGAAPVIAKAGQLTTLLQSWYDRGENYQINRNKLLALRIEETPEQFIEELVARARHTAQHSQEV